MRYKSVDALRILCAFMIVCIHILPKVIGEGLSLIHISSGRCGPMELVENDEIIELSICDGVKINPMNFRRFGIKRILVEKAYLQHLRDKSCCN